MVQATIRTRGLAVNLLQISIFRKFSSFLWFLLSSITNYMVHYLHSENTYQYDAPVYMKVHFPTDLLTLYHLHSILCSIVFLLIWIRLLRQLLLWIAKGLIFFYIKCGCACFWARGNNSWCFKWLRYFNFKLSYEFGIQCDWVKFRGLISKPRSDHSQHFKRSF